LKSKEFLGRKGTFGFGTNNAQVLFDNLYVKSQIEDPTKEAIKNKIKLKSTETLNQPELQPNITNDVLVENDEVQKPEIK